MTFVLKIDPIAVSTTFNFKCEKKTNIFTVYLAPPRIGKMIQSLAIKKNSTFYRCMWCSIIPLEPIGLPVQNVISRVSHEQISSHSGDLFSIKEDGPFEPKYLTFGIFCSPPCCKAFWLDNRQLNEFEFSGMLLQQIWNIEYGRDVKFIEAPPRQLLKIFGGVMDYDEFHAFPQKKYQIVSQIYTATVFCEE